MSADKITPEGLREDAADLLQLPLSACPWKVSAIVELQHAYAAALEENDKLRADAERYRWIPVTERLPVVDGPGVLAYDERTGMPIGVVRLTTSEGNAYAGTENDGEPVWVMWAQFDQDGPQVLIEPRAVSHWMPVPELPPAAISARAAK